MRSFWYELIPAISATRRLYHFSSFLNLFSMFAPFQISTIVLDRALDRYIHRAIVVHNVCRSTYNSRIFLFFFLLFISSFLIGPNWLAGRIDRICSVRLVRADYARSYRDSTVLPTENGFFGTSDFRVALSRLTTIMINVILQEGARSRKTMKEIQRASTNDRLIERNVHVPGNTAHARTT